MGTNLQAVAHGGKARPALMAAHLSLIHIYYPSCSMGKARAASRIACLHANVPNMIGQITAILAKDNANCLLYTSQ